MAERFSLTRDQHLVLIDARGRAEKFELCAGRGSGGDGEADRMDQLSAVIAACVVGWARCNAGSTVMPFQMKGADLM